ncbi:ankyrin repeat and LEM domain-containing protein 1 isoform X2 [Labeo rohita]|uniref:ankyrin repeat and LEM domain-containing protein 1 isoform X2 n=1 Tax=Labeo rohita TaxID=84645 RepID=UPI0021E29283|nr:ankyrin repeat and LEM domain-containing protein 1 isoform X2 [Labeo rohita]
MSSVADLETLLIDALSDADARCVESLLSRGANPNRIVRDGVAAVHLAAGKESEKGLRCLKLILQHGADPNLRTTEDLTPLHIAASWGCFQNLRILLRNGGNPNLTDQDGNKPSDLAEQEENSKCASLLQEYESHTSKEDQDAPKFQYSILSGQSMSDSSFSPETSMLIPPGAEPLSSTRLSSISSTCRVSGKPLNRESQAFWLSDVSDLESHDSPVCSNGEMCKELPILSSTCLSALDNKNNPELVSTYQRQAADSDCDVLQTQNIPVLSQWENRRSVTFRASIDYLPVSSPDDHQQFLLNQSSDLTLDLSQYPDFLDTKRTATVLQNQGIDVTCPDDVFIFSKEVDTVEDEFDKTVVGPVQLDDDDDDDDENDDEFKSIIQPHISSGSSEYNSCDSDPYHSPSTENKSPPSTKTCAQKSDLTAEQCGFRARNKSLTFVIDGNRQQKEAVRSHIEQSSLSASGRDAGKVEVTSAETDCIPSPFVTGRTRSRLSRHSERMSQKLASFQTSSCLFDQTLPTATRLRRNTVKSPYGTSKHGLDEDKVEDIDSQLSSLKLSVSSDGQSQADTLILSDSMADTVLISERIVESQLETGVSEAGNKGTAPERLTDMQEAKRNATGAPQISPAAVGDKEASDTCGLASQWSLPFRVDSSESASSLIYESPKTQKNPGANPGRSGCTPRYSMSRLSGRSRQAPANLSCTHGGQPLTTDMDGEPVEYLYTDTEEGHKLIETHVPPTANTSFSSSMSTNNSEDTLLYDWRSLQLGSTSPDRSTENYRHKQERDVGVSGLTDRELRSKLIEMGEDPGPINSQTRPLYVQKLKRSLQNTPHSQKPVAVSPSAAGYSPELENVLHRFILPNCQADELALCEQFDKPDQNKRWREGFIKSSFNYLLLDPRVTKNLPYRSQSMIPKECFQTFISAVFYVGKGKRSRPYSHLYEALEYFKGDKTSKKLCSKVQHILQVWNAGHGVISLHCFQNVIAVEAYTREACMVDAIGLKMLTNQKRGDYYGVVSTWPVRRKRELGAHLLYRAMQIFLAEGERQLRPADIR